MFNKIIGFSLAALFVILIACLIIGFYSLLVYFAWNVLIVPVWGAAKLTFLQAATLYVFISIFTNRSPESYFNAKKD